MISKVNETKSDAFRNGETDIPFVNPYNFTSLVVSSSLRLMFPVRSNRQIFSVSSLFFPQYARADVLCVIGIKEIREILNFFLPHVNR